MSNPPAWQKLDRKLIAILRGITVAEVPSHIEVLIEAGFRAIEIPLNSPDPFKSIAAAVVRAQELAAGACMIGAGTVLTVADVQQISDIGGNLVVSPNTNEAVIAKTVELGMTSLPGSYTATEAFASIQAGATALKLFPASSLGTGGIAALKAVLPTTIDICAVGGVDASNFAEYRKSGVSAFGLGSCLYKPGLSAVELRGRAAALVAAYDQISG